MNHAGYCRQLIPTELHSGSRPNFDLCIAGVHNKGFMGSFRIALWRNLCASGCASSQPTRVPETASSCARAWSIGRMRMRPRRWWRSFRPSGRAVRMSVRRVHRIGVRLRCDFRKRQCGEGIDRETGDGGAASAASEPVGKRGEDSQRVAHQVGVASVVEIADGQSEVIERGRRVAVVGLLADQNEGRCDSVKRLPLS